jgi:hypothetical protein
MKKYIQLQDDSILHSDYLVRIAKKTQGKTYQVIFTTTTDQVTESFCSQEKADYRFQQFITKLDLFRYIDPPDNIGTGPGPKE